MENENPTAVPPEISELRAQIDWLRRWIAILLVVLIVVSGTLNIFLLRQWRYATADAKTMKAQATVILGEYEKVSGPRINEFVNRVTEYGWAHSDFRPIQMKYSLSTSPPPAAVVSPKK